MEQAIESIHPCHYLQFEAQVFVANYPLNILMIIKSQRVKRALVTALADEEMIKL